MKDFFEKDNLKVGVVGSGSWATALVKVLSENCTKINWFVRTQETIDHVIKHNHNDMFLQSAYLHPDKLDMSADINEVVAASDILVFVVPSAFFLGEMANLKVSLEGKFVISAIKGFVSEENLTIAEYFHRQHGIPYDRIGVIGGPTHAEEVSLERLSYLTLASKQIAVSRALCKIFHNDYIKTIASADIYGVEYSAALKNVYAICAGICHSLGYGDNFIAVLITSAFNELIEFLNSSHPDRDRFTTKSVYLGDLLVTSYSQFSRNRTFGGMIGKGYSVISAQMEMNMVAEGYYAAKSIYEINKRYKVHMPIAEAVYKILYENKYPAYIIASLADSLQ